jgi:tRNA nucleotidyltransferase (CCA-adding enzyme)
MNHRISVPRIEAPAPVLLVCGALRSAGHEAYLVGGCVRDSLMGQNPKDWDVATNALPEEVISAFQGGWDTKVVMGPMSVEVTTYRCDGDYADGRRPDSVEFVKTIEEDLARRDFTCNAMAYSPSEHVVVDPFGGAEHMHRRKLVAVGDPHARFNEDGLRLMRAVRFMCTKGLEIGTGTLKAMIDCSAMLGAVSKERVRDELMKILASPLPHEGVKVLAGTGLLAHICPELLKGKGMHQNVKWHAYDVWDHVMACLEHCASEDPLVRLAVLLHDIAKPTSRQPHPKEPGQFQFLQHEDMGADMAEEWMRENKFSNDEIDRVKHMVRHHLVFYETGWSSAQVRRWVQRIGADLLGKGYPHEERMAVLDQLEVRAASVKHQVVRPGRDLAISGHDLLQLMGTTIGGPKVGECLRSLSDAVMEEPELNNRAALLRLAVAWVSANVNPCKEVDVGPNR